MKNFICRQNFARFIQRCPSKIIFNHYELLVLLRLRCLLEKIKSGHYFEIFPPSNRFPACNVVDGSYFPEKKTLHGFACECSPGHSLTNSQQSLTHIVMFEDLNLSEIINCVTKSLNRFQYLCLFL